MKFAGRCISAGKRRIPAGPNCDVGLMHSNSPVQRIQQQDMSKITKCVKLERIKCYFLSPCRAKAGGSGVEVVSKSVYSCSY